MEFFTLEKKIEVYWGGGKEKKATYTKYLFRLDRLDSDQVFTWRSYPDQGEDPPLEPQPHWHKLKMVLKPRILRRTIPDWSQLIRKSTNLTAGWICAKVTEEQGVLILSTNVS